MQVRKMNLMKVQMAFIFIPVIIAKIIDISDRCPRQLSNICKCYYSVGGAQVIVECERKLGPIIDYEIQLLDKNEICVLYLKNSVIVNFDWEKVGKYINAGIIIMRNMGIWNLHLFEALRSVQDTLYGMTLIHVSASYLNLTYPENAFKQLRYFHLSHCSAKRWWDKLNANSVIPRLPKYVCEIRIQRCKIKSFEDNFFARFTYLHKLDLSYNRLGSVKRNYLPRPANVFSSYDLSFNPITFLPNDMFADMPALEEILLQGTLLTTLHYRIFEPIINQLKSLAINDIPLSCNCEAAWLLTKKNSWKEYSFSCRRPTALRDRDGCSLMPSELVANCTKTPGYYTTDLAIIPCYFGTVEASSHKNDNYNISVFGGNYTTKIFKEEIVKPWIITVEKMFNKIINELRMIFNLLGE